VVLGRCKSSRIQNAKRQTSQTTGKLQTIWIKVLNVTFKKRPGRMGLEQVNKCPNSLTADCEGDE
jgi:hypothetical protein